jgi:hypothetical protein
MFAFQLLHQPFELVLCGIDLLLYQARPFLQISTDVTHRLSPARYSFALCRLAQTVFQFRESAEPLPHAISLNLD